MPSTPCVNCPLRRRPIFSPFTPSELAFMSRFKADEIRVAPGTVFLRAGEGSKQLYTVLDGMGTRSVLLENGRRQVINFLFPGDFVGLQAGLMGEMKHSAVATTRMTLCVFRREDVATLFRDHPGRAYDVTWLAAMEEHFLGEAIATIGQRDARQRIAWALVRIHRRLAEVGLARNGQVPLPFRQQDMADALGLSLVHTNKTLQALRASGLARWSGGTLEIADLPALATMGMIDAAAPLVRPLI